MEQLPTAAEFLGDPVVGLVALAVAGAFAGVINAMAGGGSFLTIPLLMALGLPAGTTNGTIRVGVLFQNIVAGGTFHRRGVREYESVVRFVLPMGAGAVGGSVLAAYLDDAILKPIFGVLFVAWALVLLFKPDSFTRPADEPRPAGVPAYFLAFSIGVYGGFIQAGVGFPLLAFLVLYLGYDAVRANAMKVLLVGLYTLAVIPIFAYAGRIAWLEAGVLALGTMLGGWLGARWQIHAGAKIVRWFVLVTVTVAGISMIASVF